MTRALMAIVHDGATAEDALATCSMAERAVNLGVIGGGLMGRELASAAARWIHLEDLGRAPAAGARVRRRPEDARVVRAAGRHAAASAADPARCSPTPTVEAVYIAVPHHLHAELYVAALEAGKHLLGEKPFGIDLRGQRDDHGRGGRAPRAAGALLIGDAVLPGRPGGRGAGSPPGASAVRSRSARCSCTRATSTPSKPINWKRRAETNGAYGCLGDLGMHALHLPLRAGWASARRACAARRHRQGAARRAGRARAVRHTRQRGPALPRRARRRGASRCASRPSASRPARRTPGRSRSTAPRARSPSPPSARRRCAR